MKSKILLILAFLISAFFQLPAQQTYPNLRVFIPEFIPKGSPFQISTIIRSEDIEADYIQITLNSTVKLDVKRIQLRNLNYTGELSYSLDDNSSTLSYSYIVRQDTEDSLILPHDNPSEIIYEFDKIFESECELGFALSYLKESEVMKNISANINSFFDEVIPSKVIKFYDPDVIAGNTLVLSAQSLLKFSFTDIVNVNNILLEFWMKLPDDAQKFLILSNKQTGEPIFYLSLNEYQIISTEYIHGLDIHGEQFIDPYSWNHYSIYYNIFKRNYLIYINDILKFSIPSNYLADFNNTEFIFNNGTKGSELSLELLKVWDYGNSINISFRNKHYLDYSADSSSLILSLNFDSNDFSQLFDGNNEIDIYIGDFNLKKSDAPLFSKAPNINVVTYSNYNLIEWTNKDAADVEKFILEKSLNGKTFDGIFEVFSTEESGYIYQYSDSKTQNNEIVYYRVKQINSDGSFLFSSQIKLGQGEQVLFELEQNFPNPFNPATTISVEIFESNDYTITIYNVVGKKIQDLHTGYLNQGFHSFTFDGTELPSGIYFCEVKSPLSSKIQKMILAK